MALFFLWSGKVAPDLGICLAMMIALVALGGFFVSAIAAPLYGGIIAAQSGLAAARIGWLDGNVANFGTALCLLLIGRVLLYNGAP